MTIRVSLIDFVDLAAEKLGGKVLLASDEFFAPKENLLKATKAIFVPDQYTDHGKWMDGWETRRRRSAGYDWCIIQLGLPGIVRGINVDTDYFIGNYPEFCSLEAGYLEQKPNLDFFKSNAFNWTEILPKVKLHGGCENFFNVNSNEKWTHLRFKIYPDGGVARLRVYGEVKPDINKLKNSNRLIDLAALENGAAVITCNDQFFGQKDNLIYPGRATHMGEGWETRRKRVPGFDWIVVKLAGLSVIKKIEVDTNHFKGNYPESSSLQGICLQDREYYADDFSNHPELPWQEILPKTALKGHFQNLFEKELKSSQPYTHVRLCIFPDGGVSRLRVYGDLV